MLCRHNKIKERHIVESGKIDRRYRNPATLETKVDEKAYKDCQRAWDKVEPFFLKY